MIEDNDNNLSVVYDVDVTEIHKRVFNTNSLKISIDLLSDDIPLIDWQTSEVESASYKNLDGFQSKIIFNFSEIPFICSEENVITNEDPDKPLPVVPSNLSIDYQQNAIRSWILKRNISKSYGFVLNITYLDLDIDSGDYLVIGSDRRPKSRYSSKSVIVTDRLTKTIYSDSNQLFIQLVTHGSAKRGESVHLIWWPQNNTYHENKNESKISDQVRRQALHICILGSKCEFDFLSSFKIELSRHINLLIWRGELQYEEFTTNRSILIFDSENRTATGVGRYCSAKLAVTRKNDLKIVIFDKHTLSPILFDDGKQFYLANRTITTCDFYEISNQEIYEIIVYLVIPFIFISLIWFHLRQYRSPLSHKSFEVLKKKFKTERQSIDSSEYENINNRLNVQDFNKLDSDNEFLANDLSQRELTLDSKASESDRLPIIELKVHSKKRVSILNKNFSETRLNSKSSGGQHINYSI